MIYKGSKQTNSSDAIDVSLDYYIYKILVWLEYLELLKWFFLAILMILVMPLFWKLLLDTTYTISIYYHCPWNSTKYNTHKKNKLAQ